MWSIAPVFDNDEDRGRVHAVAVGEPLPEAMRDLSCMRSACAVVIFSSIATGTGAEHGY